jgi:UDPglucose 6-dehydrogenase
MTVSKEIADALPFGSVVVIRSTVPPGTADQVADLLDRPDAMVASNPEFLREGTAVADFLHPHRIVVGCCADVAAELIAGLYSKLAAPVIFTSTASAELAKYAANCFLAVKLSYINEIADLCDRTGADIQEVTEVLGLDPRIGAPYLQPGPGWGGPCLPKDTQAIMRVGAVAGTELTLLRAAFEANQRQQRKVVEKVRLALGGSLADTRITLLGLTFKPGTADLRDSPAIAVATMLAAEQAQVTGYDPAVCVTVSGIAVTEDPYNAVTGADAVVVLTDWPQFRTLDWTLICQLMAGRIVIDTRNNLDYAALARAGLRCHGTGNNHPRNP